MVRDGGLVFSIVITAETNYCLYLYLVKNREPTINEVLRRKYTICVHDVRDTY